MQNKSGRQILITGAARRFGLSLVEHFLNLGDSVVAISRHSSDDLSSFQQKHPERLTIIPINDYSEAGFACVKSTLGEVSYDLLINNASLFEDDVTGEDIFAQLQALTNVHMAFPAALAEWFATQYVARANGDTGLIINITDIYSLNPKPGRAYYSATKAGLDNLTLSLAKRLAPLIRVNSIQPGTMQFLPEHTTAAKQDVLTNSLIQREAGFEPLIQAVDYLLRNTFVTGSALKVDGGRSIAR
ncbi:SDR family NAD(P)-dependent oxidoreductase [Alteromonas flava]|uniref:SDR family NAD(P)-dependent oxidoreductase n=1 Tax=Alteromonas flava TaxID=2048003 RepID=UPI0013DC23E1|nr:SDR family NAD(P)-dependent oxidoreductase [Alteromonas flava]